MRPALLAPCSYERGGHRIFPDHKFTCKKSSTLTPAYGNSTRTSAQFLICDSLEVLWAFRKAVATPWQQKPLIVSHTGIVAVNVTMPLAKSQRVREHIPAFCMKNRMRGARLTCACAGNKPRAQTFCWRSCTTARPAHVYLQ